MKSKLEKSVILLGTFLIAFMGSALTPAIPAIAGEFQADSSLSGWIVTAYMVTCTAFPVPLGRLAERTEPVRILSWGLGIFTAASLTGIFVSSMGMLLTVRSLQGIGTAMIYSIGMWILVRRTEDGQRSKLLGYSSAAMYLGLASGPAAGGILNQYLGWRWIFAAAAVISAVAFFGSLLLLRRSVSTVSGFPPPGKILPSRFSILLYVLSAVTFTAGLQMISAGWWGWSTAAAGLMLILFYVIRENRTSSPLLPVKYFRKHPSLGIHCMLSIISCGSGFVTGYLLSLYFQIGMGFSPQKAGLILIVSPAVQAIAAVAVGKTAARKPIRPRRLAAAGILGSGAVAVYFAGIDGQWTDWRICAGLAAAGIFSALFTAPNSMEVMSAAGKENAGLAASLISTVRSLGNCIGVASAAFASSLVLGQARLSEAAPSELDEVVSYVFSFWAALCILGFFMELRKKV